MDLAELLPASSELLLLKYIIVHSVQVESEAPNPKLYMQYLTPQV